MPTYLITNRVPDGFAPSPEAFAAWTAWFDSAKPGFGAGHPRSRSP